MSALTLMIILSACSFGISPLGITFDFSFPWWFWAIVIVWTIIRLAIGFALGGLSFLAVLLGSPNQGGRGS